MSDTELTLAYLAYSETGKKFDERLAEALAHIADEKTPACPKRTITLTLELHPEEDRSLAAIAVKVDSKLPAAPTLLSGHVDLVQEGKKQKAVVHGKQGELFKAGDVATSATREDMRRAEKTAQRFTAAQ